MGIFVPFLFFIVISIFKIVSNVRNDRDWHVGLFEGNDSYNEKNYDPLLETYIKLGALMVSKDTSAYGDKILYLNSYFSKNFPNTHYHFGRSFTDALKDPTSPQAISKWLRRKMPQTERRVQVMYFLAGLSTVDGSMNEREIELLKEMNTLLELSPADFERIIAMYTQKHEQKATPPNSKPRLSEIQIASKIMGVSEHASKDEIKKAYRHLVKLHHPDCFATETIEQQAIAAEKFREIQRAYEVLERK
jgi:DnaJ like chaperone protein